MGEDIYRHETLRRLFAWVSLIPHVHVWALLRYGIETSLGHDIKTHFFFKRLQNNNNNKEKKRIQTQNDSVGASLIHIDVWHAVIYNIGFGEQTFLLPCLSLIHWYCVCCVYSIGKCEFLHRWNTKWCNHFILSKVDYIPFLCKGKKEYRTDLNTAGCRKSVTYTHLFHKQISLFSFFRLWSTTSGSICNIFWYRGFAWCIGERNKWDFNMGSWGASIILYHRIV